MDIGVIKVRVALDENSLAQAMEDLKGKARSFNGLVLNPQVDDKQLTALNKHLDLKVSHYKQVQRYFKDNPLKITTDTSSDRRVTSNSRTHQVNREITEIKINSRDFEASFKRTSDSFIDRFSKVEIRTKAPKVGLGNLISAPIKAFTDEFIRETSRSFTRGTGITRASQSAGKSTGKFTVERGTEFADHAAKNLLMYEEGLKGLKADIDILGKAASDFLHPEPFYAAVDKMETYFAKFLHETFYGQGLGSAFDNVGDDLEKSVKGKLEQIKGLSSLVNTNVAGEIKSLASKKGDELKDAIRNLSPEAKPLYERIAKKAREQAINEGVTKKKDQQVRVGQILSNPQNATKISAEVAQDMMQESGANGLLRPLNVLMRSFRVTTNSLRKMNAIELDKMAGDMAGQYKAIIPKMTATKKQLIVYASAASDFGRGSEEHAPIIQAQFPNANIAAPTFDEYDFKKNHQSPNVFQNVARGVAKPLKGGLIAGGGGEVNEGAEILADTLSGYMFGYSKSVARVLATVKAALDEGYKLEDIQLVGFSQGSQVVRNAVDTLTQMGIDVKAAGVGIADYLDALVPTNKNYQSFFTNQDSLNLPAQVGLVPSSGKEIKMDAMDMTKDGHALFQVASQPEFLQKATEHGIQGARQDEFDPKAMSRHLLNYQRLIAPMRTNQLVGNLISDRSISEGIASRPTDPLKRYKAVEDFSSLLSMLKGGANKILRDYSPKNLEATANNLGVKPDAEFLGVGNKLYLEYESAVSDLAQAMGVATEDLKSNLSGLEGAGEALEAYKQALSSLDNGSLDLSATTESIASALGKLPVGSLQDTLADLIVDLHEQGESALELSKNSELLSNALRITSFKAKDGDFINDPRNSNQVPSGHTPIYDKTQAVEPLVPTPAKLKAPLEMVATQIGNAAENIKDAIASKLDEVATVQLNSQLARVPGQSGTIDIGNQVNSVSELKSADVLKLTVLGVTDTLKLFQGAVSGTYKALSAVEKGVLAIIPAGQTAKGLIKNVGLPAAAYAGMAQFPVTGGLLNALGSSAHHLLDPAVANVAGHIGGGVAGQIGGAFGTAGRIGSMIGSPIAGSLGGAASSAITSLGEVAINAGSVMLAGKGAIEASKALVPKPIKDTFDTSVEGKIEKAIAASTEKAGKTLIGKINEVVDSAANITVSNPKKAQKLALEARSRVLPQLQAAQDEITRGAGKGDKSARLGGAIGNFKQTLARIDKIIEEATKNAVSPLEKLSALLSDVNAEPVGQTLEYIEAAKNARKLFSQKIGELKQTGDTKLAQEIQQEATKALEALQKLDAEYKRIGGMPKALRSEVTAAKKVATSSGKTAAKIELNRSSNVGDGLHNAMKSAEVQAGKDSEGIAKTANKAFEEEMEIRSPSRKWFRYGAYMMQGLSNGLASVSIMKPITNQVQQAANYLNRKGTFPKPTNPKTTSIQGIANYQGYQGGQQAANAINLGVNAANQAVQVATPVVKQGIGIAKGGVSGFIAGLNQELQVLQTRIPGLNTVMKVFNNLKALGVGVAAFAFLQTFQQQLIDFGKASFDAALKYESFNTLLTATSSSSGAASQSIATIDAAVNKLNVSLSAARQGYVQLQASTQGTSLEGAGADSVFNAVSQASSVYQLNPEQTDRVFLAIQQMASKGTVSAEELRQQLGESLPGAMGIAARSMGLTTKEFNKLVETGQVASADFLPKFAAQLSQETKSGVAGAANSAQGKLNKLNNSILRLQETAGKLQLGAASLGLNLLIPVIEKVPGLFLAATAAVSLLAAQLIFLAGKPILGALTGFLRLATGATTTAGAVASLGLQLAKLAGYSLLAMGVMATLQIVISAFGDKGGKFREWADASKVSLDAMSDAIDKASGKASNLQKIESKDLKGEGRLGGTIIGSLVGKDSADFLERGVQQNATYRNVASFIPGVGTVANLLKTAGIKTPFDKKLNLRTYAQEQAEARTIGANDQITRSNDILIKGQGQVERARIISKLNRNLEQRQLEAQGYERQNPGDTTGIRRNNEELSRLTKERDTESKDVIATQQAYQTQIDNTKAAIKELKDNMAAGSVTTDDYNNQMANYSSVLVATEKAQQELNAALDDSNKRFTNAGIVIAKLGAKLEDYLSQTDYTKSLKDVQTYIQQINGSLSSQQGDYVRQLTAQASLLDSIAEKQRAVTAMRNEIGEDNIDAVLNAFGLDKNTVGQAQLQAAAPQATTAQQKLVLENYGKVVGLNQEIAGMQGQYYQGAAQLKQQVKDTNKAVADYLRQASETLADTRLSIAQSDIQSAATQAGNAIKRSVVKFKQTFASSLIDSIVELIELTSKLSLSAIQQKMDISAATRKLQESQRGADELQRQLTSGLNPQEASIPGQPSSVGYSSYSATPITVFSGGRSVKSLGQVNKHHDYQTSKDGKGRMVVDIVLQNANGVQNGAAIPSPVSGTVIRKKDPGGFGNFVDIIDENKKVLARLGHLSEFVAKKNQRVNVGDTVALQGNTGRSTGTHLHLEAAKEVIASYIPMLTNGKSTQLSTPTYNKLDGSVGRNNATSEVEAFAKKTVAIANQLGIEPRHLFGIMGAESNFSPSVRNQIGATGLIQFMPKTAEGLGTTTNKLAKMSRVDQLDYVKAFFQEQIDRTGVDFKKTGIMGAYGAVFANDPFNKKGANVTDGQSTLAGTVRRAEQNYGKQIDAFMAAAGKTTQVSINAVTSTASIASNAVDTNFDALLGVGKDQLAQARSLSVSQYKTEIAEANKRRKLEDDNTKLAVDQSRAKASQSLREGTRQVSDENISAIRQQQDIGDTLGYGTPTKELQIQIKEINRSFEDQVRDFGRKLEDLKSARDSLQFSIKTFADQPNLDPTGELTKQARSSLSVVNQGIGTLESVLSKAADNRNKKLADIQQKFADAEIKRLEQVSNQMNELDSQGLNQLADAAQKKLDLNPDDYSIGDPIQIRLKSQQKDLTQAYDNDLSAMRDMVRTGERTAAEATLYNEQRKQLLESSLKNAQADADSQQKAVVQARDQRRRERIDRLNQTLANNEQRNFEVKQARDSIFTGGADNYAANLRNSARNAPMSYLIDQANNLDYQSKIAQTTNETQSRLRDLMLEQNKTQERLRQINELSANPARSLEDTARLQQLQLEQSASKTPKQIRELIELTKYLDAQKLDNIKQEYENLVSDRAKERLRNMIEIESTTFQSGQDLLGARGNLAGTLGFGVISQKYQKESAINQQGFDYSAGLRSIEDFAEKTGASADTVAQLKKNLEELNSVKLASIEAEFNPFTQVLGDIQQGFQSTIAGVITGSKSLSEGLNEMLGNVANSLANLAAQWITNELFGSLFGLGGKGMGGQQAGELFGGGGGIGSIFSGIFGFAEGGDVATDGKSELFRTMPNAIGHAMRKEGANSVLATLTPGERVLTVSEAKLYRAIHPQGIAATTRMPSISNFATGGDVSMASSFSNVGGATTVNVPVTIDGGGEKLDANAISNAVRKGVIAEINNQRRANGLLSR